AFFLAAPYRAPAAPLASDRATAMLRRQQKGPAEKGSAMSDAILRGKRAIVTGSNSGIGLGIAEALAGAGAEVILNSFTDRDEDHALARDLSDRHGVAVRYIAADMSKPADCRALVEKAGDCDILVNNA